MINQLHHPNLIVGKQSFQHSAVRSFIPQGNSTQLEELKLHYSFLHLKPETKTYLLCMRRLAQRAERLSGDM